MQEIYDNDEVLNSPLGKKASLDYIQKIFRLRTDLNNLYAGRKQQFNSLMHNPDYKSILAEEARVPTWIPVDPMLRQMY